jgi:arginase
MPETEPSKKPRVALLGIPIEIGASQRGTLMGPDALRTAGIGRVLEQLGFDVEDHGNLALSAAPSADGLPPANAKYYDDIKGWRRSQPVDGIGERRRAILAGA